MAVENLAGASPAQMGVLLPVKRCVQGLAWLRGIDVCPIRQELLNLLRIASSCRSNHFCDALLLSPKKTKNHKLPLSVVSGYPSATAVLFRRIRLPLIFRPHSVNRIFYDLGFCEDAVLEIQEQVFLINAGVSQMNILEHLALMKTNLAGEPFGKDLAFAIREEYADHVVATRLYPELDFGKI